MKTRFLTTVEVLGERPVVRGLFAFCSTIGFPMPDAIAFAWHRGYAPDWLHLLSEMVDEGRMKPDRARRALEAAIEDAALMPVDRDDVLRRLAYCLDVGCAFCR